MKSIFTIFLFVGGGPCDPHEYPYQIALIWGGSLFCGGSLITQKHVLTAAHCTVLITDADYEYFKVRLAEHDLYNTGTDCAYDVDVEQIVIHPSYNASFFDNDFSILGEFLEFTYVEVKTKRKRVADTAQRQL